MPQRTLSVKEAAVYLRVQPRTVRLWISHGKLGATRVGQAYVIPESEVARMITSGGSGFDRSRDSEKKSRIACIRGCLRGTAVTTETLLAERRREAELRKLKAERSFPCR